MTNPRWLFALHTLPMLVFAWLCYQQYTLVESILEPHNRAYWSVFGWVTAGFTVAVALYAAYLVSRERRIDLVGTGVLFMTGAMYAAYVLTTAETMMPWRLPRWLGSSNDLVMYLATFGMPTMGYCLLAAVHILTPEDEDIRVAPNILGMLAVPVVAYLSVMVMIPIISATSAFDLGEYLAVVFLILGTTVFLFFLVRSLFLLARKRSIAFEEYRHLWLVPVAFLFPLGGLALNSLLAGGSVFSHEGVFGDFGHPLFYLVAFMNGILLCLGSYDGKLYRLFTYLAKAAGMAYVTYFFLVFLPYLPLGVLAILLAGVGFLMLTPLMLFAVQGIQIREDFNYLTNHFGKPFLLVTGLLAFGTPPLLMGINYAGDNAALDQALDHVYAPADAGDAPINLNRLERVLTNISSHKGRSRGMGFSGGTPYLSSFYRWLVLDNLTLSNSRMNDLRRVFFGEPGRESGPAWRANNRNVELTDADVQSEWDPKEQAWSSWVDLQLTRVDSTFGRGEYVTEFDPPPGVFIADYYLYVGDRKEYGMLAERKAAVWVYNNIVGTNRDPGMLRYVDANTVAFNVFPFTGGETRRTGIRFLHKEPVSFDFDGTTLNLGRVGEHPVTEPLTDEDGTTIYLSKAAKAALTRVQRKVGVHFVVDASRKNVAGELRMIERMKAFVATLPADAAAPRVTLAGTYAKTFGWTDDWEAALAETPEGGFFTQRGIHRALAHPRALAPDTDYQIVVAINAASTDPVYLNDFSALAAVNPEGDDFYYLEGDGTLSLHRLNDEPGRHRENVAALPPPTPVLLYKDADGYEIVVPDDGLPTVTAHRAVPDFTAADLTGGSWADALTLRRRYLHNQREGETGYRPWLAEVQGSFRTGALMPTTAYLVVENEAQKEALRRKQSQTLAADPAFDASESEETRSMSEPWWVWMLGMLVFTGVVVRRKM